MDLSWKTWVLTGCLVLLLIWIYKHPPLSREVHTTGIVWVQVKTPNGTVEVESNFDTPDILGSNLDADDLVARVRHRITSTSRSGGR